MIGNSAKSAVNGFTLIELLITITIVGIIAVFAAPNISKNIKQAKIKEVASLIETALKDARTQALINQRSTRVVFTNTTTSKKATVYYVKRATTDADEKLSEYEFDKNITLTFNPTTLSAVSFTPTKRGYQGETASGTLLDGTTNLSICYGAGLDKYIVSVDASSNIVNSKNGTC